MSRMSGSRDAVVVGGGPAGLAAAIALRGRNLRVRVMDGAALPLDKACGEGILPAGVDALARLGVRLSEEGVPLRGIRFLEGRDSVETTFPSGCGHGIARWRLHQILRRHAEAAGVEFEWQSPWSPAVDGSDVWLIGADGQASMVRKHAALEQQVSFSRRFGFRRRYAIRPWTDRVEVYWGVRCQLYVTPIAEDEISLAMLTRDSRLRIDDALPGHADLERRLRHASRLDADRGGLTTTRWLRRVASGNTALVGDASGSVDAIGGEGLSLCFLEALALAGAIDDGDLDRYQVRHRRLWLRPAVASGMLLGLEALPRARRLLFRIFSARPALFRRLLALHV